MKMSSQVPEPLIEEVKKKYGLHGLHIFDQDGGYRVFGYRADATGFRASVEQGSGETMDKALIDLSENLKIGPIAANKKRAALLPKNPTPVDPPP